MDTLTDGTRRGGGAAQADLEPFWPSRQQCHFDQTCCRSTSAQVCSA
ncbi:hypothetical protein [Streptacidiphilus monticola]|jgi:hypothetical protein|uniref:Uncharacterized protein n=1 Tax=Streptacidiphilus monticola TaxID=2161674 RepID=A0ABW1FZX0_9ACTN